MSSPDPLSPVTPRSGRRAILALGAVLVVVALGAAIYRLSFKNVTLSVDGRAQEIDTRAGSVAELLDETNVLLAPEDRVLPGLDAPLQQGMTVAIQRAHTVLVEADGEVRRVRTQAIHPLDILDEQGIAAGIHDVVRVDGHDYGLTKLRQGAWDIAPSSIYVVRSATLHVQDNGRTLTIHTTQPDVGRALDEAGFELYLADAVDPGFGTQIEDGMTVQVQRSHPVAIEVDGRTLHTRATGGTVGDVLVEVGVAPMGLDYTEPALEAIFEPGMTIRVVRVIESLDVEREAIPYRTVTHPDFSLPRGAQRVELAGRPGVLERQIRVRYEAGAPVERTAIGEEVVTPPRAEVIVYGVRSGAE